MTRPAAKPLPRPDRRCCDWDTFLDGFLSCARQKRLPLLLVDRCLARRHWRQGMTSLEAVCSQLVILDADLYLSPDERQE